MLLINGQVYCSVNHHLMEYVCAMTENLSSVTGDQFHQSRLDTALGSVDISDYVILNVSEESP